MLKQNITFNNKTNPILIMMVGLPGSGKSTQAELISKQYDFKIHSSDDLRLELYGDVNNMKNNKYLFDELHNRLHTDLLCGNNVIYDATNINKERRVLFLKSLNNIIFHKACVFLDTPYDLCLKYNKSRKRVLPDGVIYGMSKSLQVPDKSEGFDEIIIVKNCC